MNTSSESRGEPSPHGGSVERTYFSSKINVLKKYQIFAIGVFIITLLMFFPGCKTTPADETEDSYTDWEQPKGSLVSAKEAAGTVDIDLEIGKGAGVFEAGFMFFPGFSVDSFEKTSNEDITLFGIKLGLYYSFIGTRWFLNAGPGITLFFPYDSSSSSGSSSGTGNVSVIPFFQTRFDFRVYSIIYLRAGYRLDFYPDDLSPVFENNSFMKAGDFFMTHNILFGAGILF